MFCNTCGAEFRGDDLTHLNAAAPANVSLSPGRIFALYLIRRHPVRGGMLCILALLSALAFQLSIGSVGQNLIAAYQFGDLSEFFSIWFWGAIPVALAFLALPFLVASLFVQWNSQENQEVFAKRFMNRQLLIALFWGAWICVQTARSWSGLFK